jgi:DNA-binding winged helix-turn-helix (wHTH) protein
MAVFEFGPFVLDPAKRTLLREGTPQSLAPKAFDLLLLLVEQRERVVSKDELLGKVWPGTFVDEANLSQQIFMLRKALNRDGGQTDYIANIPRRGYSFVARVTERSASPEGRDPAGQREVRSRNRWMPKPASWLSRSARSSSLACSREDRLA